MFNLENTKYHRVTHSFPPFYNSDSEILILGSMPSTKSREVGFYYMHQKNRFWKILENVFNENIGDGIEAKKEFLTKHKIALWDVLKSCDIHGSSDASIKNVEVNDINKIIKSSNIKKIYTTGKKSYQLYNKYILNDTKIEAILLPSPSPANCQMSLETLVENYQVINTK